MGILPPKPPDLPEEPPEGIPWYERPESSYYRSALVWLAEQVAMVYDYEDSLDRVITKLQQRGVPELFLGHRELVQKAYEDATSGLTGV